MMHSVFTLRDVGVILDGREVLAGIHLDIPKNETIFLLGRSGAGKTTLLRVLNRLNECVCACTTTGEILFHHNDRRSIRPYGGEISLQELRRLVGIVFQHPNVLPMSIESNIIMPLTTVHGFTKRAAQDMARQALEETQLWTEVSDRLSADARTLSGGQQQRLCLARALAMQPAVLLLDEPTASLDYHAAKGIEELLATLKNRYTMVVVSHSLEFALRLGDTFAVLQDGRLQHLCSKDAAWTSHQELLTELKSLY